MMYKWRASLFTFLLIGTLGLIFFTTSSAYAACPDDIFFYLKLDEAAGSDYVDFIKGNDGTGSVNVAAATGIVNGAQDFNGTDTEINVPADNSFDWQSNESFSIELWMQFGGAVTPPGTTQVMISRTDGTMAWWVGINGGDGLVSLNMRDTAGNGAVADLDGVGTIDLSNGAWHHVVAVRDESTNENILYVDGVEQGRAAFNFAGFGSATAALNIGHFGSGFYYDGLIDEVALYDRALPLSEIQAHHTDGLAGKGIDYVAPGNGDDDDDDDDDNGGGGGGGGGGCFITTVAK